MLGVEVELAEAAAAGSVFKCGGIGQARSRPSLAPESDDWPLRDIERAAGRLRQFLRCRQDREQILADTHRAPDRRLGDLVQLAVRPVV